MTSVYLIETTGMPIFEQLQIEEALLRADHRNFVLINSGSPQAIVLGLSGNPQTLCDLNEVNKKNIPLIQRYSGGGTIFVDENTLFVSFIFSKNAINAQLFPEPIMRWSAEIYQSAWSLKDFQLIHNDFTIHDRKCGGNAQYLCKDRFVHHTSFLWDYQDENMKCLHLPEKQPKYRQNRSHSDFLCRLKDVAPSRQELIQQLKNELVKRFDIRSIKRTVLSEIRKKQFRKSTKLLFQ